MIFFLKGTISLSPKGDGFVKLESGNETFVFSEHTNGSIQADEVLVIPKALGRKNKLESKVIKVIKRSRKYFRFLIDEVFPSRYATGFLLDLDGVKIEGFLDLKKIQKGIKINPQDVIVVKLDKLLGDGLYQVIFDCFENTYVNDIDLFRISIKYNYELNYPEVELPYSNIVSKKTVKDWDTRKDLRELYTITIDGDDSKDFDDAISFSNDTIYVHIADVSYYVEKDSTLDKEAYLRSNSSYLGANVIPMLPKLLSENLCSLVSEKNRLAFTVEMKLDRYGNFYESNFYKSIIKVNKRYTYNNAEKEIQKRSNPFLNDLIEIAYRLRNKRIENGKLDLNLTEKSFLYDELYDIKSILHKNILQSNILIEEFMLSANTQVAEFVSKKEFSFLYRIHEKMDEGKLELLNEFLKVNGLKTLNEVNSSEIIQRLKQVSKTNLESIFNILLLRSFMQAAYSNKSIGHWGLGFKYYCHFTSPIRRYADLVCHRILDNLLKNEHNLYSDNELAKIGIHTSQMERKAVSAERDYSKIKVCKFLKNSQETDFTSIITGFKGKYIYVEIEKFLVEGVLKASEFSYELEVSTQSSFKFFSKKFSRYFVIGDKIETSLDRVDLEDMKVYLSLKNFKVE